MLVKVNADSTVSQESVYQYQVELPCQCKFCIALRSGNQRAENEPTE